VTFDEDDLRHALNARSAAPSPEFRGRLSAALREGRPGQDQMPRLAAVAAVVLAVAAVGMLVFIRGLGPSPVVTPGGKASPVATASAPPASPSPSPHVVLPGQAVISAPSHDVVWALVVSQDSHSYLFRSTDHGQTWELRPLPAVSGQAVEISFIDDHEGWLSAVSSPATQCSSQGIGIWHTTDAGATWQRLAINGIAEAQCKAGLSFTDRLHGFIGAYDDNGRAVIYRTTDGGRAWQASTKLPDPPGFKSQAGGWYLAAGRVRQFGAGLVVSVDQSNPLAGHVYISSDGGATWRYAATVPISNVDIAFVSQTHWLQLIAPGQSKETTDGGHTWHASASDYSQAAPITPDVVFADGEVGYATVRGDIQVTLDGGQHWTQIKTPGT
jgi:photosystem II stability/assembly factor-like uncharacterized protein